MSLPSFTEQLRALVAEASVSSTQSNWDMGNRGVIDLLASWLEQLGFAVEIQPLTECGHKANLIAVLGQGEGGLVLAGHSDTVPFDESLWQSNPLALTEKDGRFYGLGVCDMKGFFPQVLEAVAAVDASKLRAPIIVIATADEESSMNGARALAQLGKQLGRACVIGEPTDLKPIRLHKGVMFEGITVTGQSGHSSNPAYGANAMEAMNEAISRLLRLRADWQSRYRNAQFQVASPTLNLGYINGGDNPNRICGCCELHFDIRPLPGMNVADLQAEIDLELSRIPTLDGKLHLQRRSLVESVPPFEQAADSELIQLVEKLTGTPAGSVAFGTEAPFMQQLGMETVVLGAGSIAQAHQPDEYLDQAMIAPMIDTLKQLIAHYCL